MAFVMKWQTFFGNHHMQSFQPAICRQYAQSHNLSIIQTITVLNAIQNNLHDSIKIVFCNWQNCQLVVLLFFWFDSYLITVARNLHICHNKIKIH